MVLQQKRAVVALVAMFAAFAVFQFVFPLFVGVLDFGVGSLAIPFLVFVLAGLSPLVVPLHAPPGESTRDEMVDAIAERATRLAGLAATLVAAVYCLAKYAEYAFGGRSHISVGHLMLIAMTTLCTFFVVRPVATLVLHARVSSGAGDPH